MAWQRGPRVITNGGASSSHRLPPLPCPAVTESLAHCRDIHHVRRVFVSYTRASFASSVRKGFAVVM